MSEYSATAAGSTAVDNGIKRIPMNSVWTAVENCMMKRDYQTAKAVLTEAGREAVLYGDLSGQLQVLHERIVLARKTEAFSECDDLCNQATELLAKLNMQSTVAAATLFVNIADTLIAEQRYRDALRYLEPAITIIREHPEAGKNLILAGAYNSSGLALTAIKQYEEAQDAYNNALTVLLQNPSSVLDTAVTHINMAHLLNLWTGNEEEVNRNLITAFKLLDSKDLAHDYRYADTCLQCADSFEYFGFFLYKNQLRQRAADFYGEE